MFIYFIIYPVYINRIVYIVKNINMDFDLKIVNFVSSSEIQNFLDTMYISCS